VKAYTYIACKLVRVLDRLPSETAAAVLLLVLAHPGILSFGMLTVVGGIVTWWLVSVFTIHIWPELPPDHQQYLLKVRTSVLLKTPDQDRRTTRDDESAFSRGSQRHPHW